MLFKDITCAFSRWLYFILYCCILKSGLSLILLKHLCLLLCIHSIHAFSFFSCLGLCCIYCKRRLYTVLKSVDGWGLVQHNEVTSTLHIRFRCFSPSWQGRRDSCKRPFCRSCTTTWFSPTQLMADFQEAPATAVRHDCVCKRHT